MPYSHRREPEQPRREHISLRPIKITPWYKELDAQLAIAQLVFYGVFLTLFCFGIHQFAYRMANAFKTLEKLDRQLEQGK